MNKLDLDGVQNFINTKISEQKRIYINTLKDLTLPQLLNKNLYFILTKNIGLASKLIERLLEVYLSPLEEKLFDDLLEELAIHIAEQTVNGRKSSTKGIDLEFDRGGINYIVSIKSGPNWGNSSQYASLRRDFQTATKVLKQSKQVSNVQPVLGICYGKTKTTDNGQYQKITGQNFWFFLSNQENLYTEIIKPIGYEAKRHNQLYEQEKAKVYNQFTLTFLNEFCPDGQIDWDKLVKFNSGNLYK